MLVYFKLAKMRIILTGKTPNALENGGNLTSPPFASMDPIPLWKVSPIA